MIAFQNTKTGLYLRRASETESEWVKLLADSMPWHPNDEKWMRERYGFLLSDCRTVTFSSRIDHPANDLARLTREELAERYPI